MRVLVTGAAGWTAAAIIEAVRRAGHEITAFDLPAAIGGDGVKLASWTVVGDVAEFADVFAATESADAVIHLAVAVGDGAYRAPDLPFAVNVKGTYNVFESARRRGTNRIVLMSEAAVHLPLTDAARLNALTDWKSDPGGDHLYDLTKRLQEEIAKDFSATFGMTAVVLRAGYIVDGRAMVDARGRPLEHLEYARDGWVCRYDLAHACVRALEFARPGYAAFHVIGSRQAERRFDVARTARELGFTFASRFDHFGTTSPT